jgi:hypothetical protein
MSALGHTTNLAIRAAHHALFSGAAIRRNDAEPRPSGAHRTGVDVSETIEGQNSD